MIDDIDVRIRQALEAEALAYDPPDDLASRTIAAARESLGEPDGGSPGIRRRWAYLGAAAAVVLIGLLVGSSTRQRLFSRPERATSSANRGQASVMGDTAATSGSALGTVAAEPVLPPQIARTATVEIRVKSGRFGGVWSRANVIATTHGGFTTTSSLEQLPRNGSRAEIAMRVPSARMDAALADIRRLGEVVRLSTSGEDVSAQIVDLDARMRSLRVQETQYLELVRSARSVADILEIRTRLDGVRQEIERSDAQRKQLEGRVAMGTIAASLFERDAAPVDRTPGRFARAWDRAVNTLLSMLAGLLVIAAVGAPFVAVAAAIWYVVRRSRRVV